MAVTTYFSGFKIKGLRLKHGFLASYVAEKLDITPTYLSLIESGKKVPSMKVIKKASTLFDIPIEDFFENPALINDINQLSNKIDISNVIAVLEMIIKKDLVEK